jgi:predicted RecB family nuclease
MSEREKAARKAYEAVDQALKTRDEAIAQAWKAYNEAKA